MNKLINEIKNTKNDLLLKRKIKKLLDLGVDINQKDLIGKTPLMLTILEGNKKIETIKYLLKNNSNILLKDKVGNSAISMAITLYLPEIVKEIIKEGIKKNKNFFSSFEHRTQTILTFPYLLKRYLLKELKDKSENKTLWKETLNNKISEETKKNLTKNEKDIINKIFNLDKIIENILIYSEYNLDIFLKNKKGIDIFDLAKLEDDQNLLNLLNKYQLIELESNYLEEKKEEKFENLKDSLNTNLNLDLNEDFSFL